MGKDSWLQAFEKGEMRFEVNEYEGTRVSGYTLVTVNGHPLNPRHDLRDHSPTGLEWGYGGSGPAQLALAILAHEYDDEFAQMYYQDFKWAVVARLPKRAWTLTSEEIALALAELGISTRVVTYA